MSEPSRESPLQAVLSVLTTLGPPLTIATALMIYFGWARSDTQAREMGLDVSLFGFSAQDYIMNSISSLYLPLLVIAGLALGGLAVHRRVDAALRRTESRAVLRTAGRIALLAGLAAIALAVVLAAAFRSGVELFAPLVVAVGTVVAAYGAWLRTAAGDSGPAALPVWHRALRMLLIGGVVTAALFWAVSDFATVVGRGYALQIQSDVPDLPRVTAVSSTPLGVEGPGVTETPVVLGGKVLYYRTTGLRLLAGSGGRMFLLHDGWTPGHGTVIVLPDSDQIRWQFSR
ncbi:hypothetical protein ACFV9C_40395 [Kribbella sp. NPDC059898]|uniref:hypothetical protein n=1 Tax=Kribbella sp. NPDC059898 TaxID=3346995 RepID=UPI003660965E